MDHAAVAGHQQFQVGLVDLGHVHGLEARAEQAQAGQALQWAHAVQFQALLHLEGSLVDMHVDAGIQLLGEHQHLLQLVVADRVGRVGAEGYLDARVLLEVVEQAQALAQGFLGVARARGGEVQHRDGQLSADAALVHQFAGHFREEVHVGEAADAALELLGDGQFGAVADERFVDPLGLGGPDVVLQPVHQRQIVGQAAEQGHGGMAVGVDQAGGEHAVRQLAHLRGRMAQRLGARSDQGDAPVANAQAVLAQHHAGGLDGHQPGGQEQQIERLARFGHGICPGK